MARIMLHNLCIERNGPCEPRWKLEVKDIELFEKPLKTYRELQWVELKPY